MRIGVALVLVMACGKAKTKAPVDLPAVGSASRCTSLPFAPETPVPEASAAAWLDIAGKPALLVIGDSGNHGAYGLVDPDTGATLEQGNLPLGDTSDDLEGLSAHDGVIYGLVSSGWAYAWKRTDGGFALVDGPYPIADRDSEMVCKKHKTNCGRNYEGLCLAPQAGSDGCAGYAASKGDGKLYCVTFDADHRLAVHREGAIDVDAHDRLADCTYDQASGTLWAANNLLGLSEVFRVEGGRAVPFDAFGPGFPEVIAVRGDIFYRMSDLGGAPSLMAKFRCTASTK